MKIFLTIFSCLLLVMQTHAQDSLIFETTNQAYIVKRNHPSQGYRFVYNRTNSDNPTPVDKSWVPYIDSGDNLNLLRNLILEACRKVWKEKKSDLQSTLLSLGLYFDHTGTVCKITFSFKENPSLEIEDLAKLETEIVNKLQLPIDMTDKESFDYLHLLHMVKLKEL